MKDLNEKIKKLRSDTGAPFLDVKKILVEVDGDVEKATKILLKRGYDKAEKKSERETSAGNVFSYTHHSGKIGVVVEILCETDFVARNKVFKQLGHEVALQIASMDPKDVKELMLQEYVRDSKLTIHDLVRQAISKTGENIQIGKFKRIELGR